MSFLKSGLSTLLAGSLAMTGIAGCVGDEAELGTTVDDIIGGFPAASARWDAVGALGTWNGDGYRPFCTASLITPTAVITAEHCLGNLSGVSFLIGFDARTPKRAVPVLGGAGEPTIVGGFVGLGSDVAIVHLAEPVTDIQPLRLGNLSDITVGAQLIAMGYGYQDNNLTIGTRFLGAETYNGTGGNFLDYLFGSLEGFRPHYPELAGWVKFNWPTPEAVYDASALIPDYEAHFGGRDGNAQDCNGDSGGPILRSNGGQLTAYGVVSGGWGAEELVCTMGGVFATFGPATQTFIARELACPMIPLTGKCDGDSVVRCATPDEGGYRPLVTDCSILGETCGWDAEIGALGCVEEAVPVPLSCEGECGNFVSDPVTGAGCYCDTACTGAGDCCSDYTQFCTGDQPIP